MLIIALLRIISELLAAGALLIIIIPALVITERLGISLLNNIRRDDNKAKARRRERRVNIRKTRR